MPFKKFPDEDGEARVHPVAFGPPASSTSNGNASAALKKAADSDADGLLPWPNHADNSRSNSRRKSPTRPPARTSSPSRPSSLPNGSSASTALDRAIQTEPALPSYQSMANAGRFLQRSHALVDNTLIKSSANLRAQDVNTNAQNLPAFSMRNTSEVREPRARYSFPQEQVSKSFASAIQQLGPTQDSSAISLSAEQQREEMARGRRLRRFNDPITKGSPPVAYHVENQNAADQVVNKRAKGSSSILTMEARCDMQDNATEPEGQDGVAERDWQSTEIILGICPDMCPESERFERERKGDLDRLERLDGDRNQTSKDLAVKKYTRTAEKHASLIRPIVVLLKTMNHLLDLLNRGYDEEILNLHNFLWDRMRAIRMDLRMQHIFNQQAVVMHEQMIRFHILAMHELCEYVKGEGFIEGFDAHLNIEQMNKASVDLFHMYDDLRKAGITFASEAEFRGYYALLKLDKHPGYVVEPAELSLDLAKMTPEVRNTPEVQFARKVARACRSGNYLAFFRLARDATYLQACLMHAHFSKLRSQAMASLHSGLQRNQGIPIVQVEDWLGMEGEDIEALLEYHGFSLKNYEEPYMVKEGSFVRKGQAFRTRHSRLVEEKRSQIIKDDVLSSGQDKMSTAPVLERISSLRRQSDLQPPTELAVVDEEMPDYEEDEQPQESLLDHLGIFPGYHRDVHLTYGEAEMQVPVPVHLTDVSSSRSMQEGPFLVRNFEQDDNEWFEIGKRKKITSPFVENSESGPTSDEHIVTSRDKKIRMSEDPPMPASLQFAGTIEANIAVVEADHQSHQEEKERQQEALKAEVNRYKVRLVLRTWRARAAEKAEERQWQQEKLEAALSSFHVGLPVQRNKKVFFPEAIHGNHNGASSGNCMELNFMQTEDSRLEKIQQMWRPLDVIEVVSPVLKCNNPLCKFLCWKLVMCSGVHPSDGRVKGKCGEWLLAKVLHEMPYDRVKDEEIFYTDNSVDSFCVASGHREIRTPVFYLARDLYLKHTEFQDTQASKGASGVLFLVSQNSSLDEERRRLHALVDILQSGVKLPLLVVYSRLSELTDNGANDSHDDAGALAEFLSLNNLDKTKVACWMVSPIMEHYVTSCPPTSGKDFCPSSGSELRGFYSEELLKKALSWLASQAPIQPNLRGIHVQDLVIEKLQPSIEFLSTMDQSHVTPQMCVEAFNEALLKTANEVNSAAADCHLYWPPDELRKVFEKLMGQRAPPLPSPGWNEATYLRPIIEALSLTQLPKFPLISIPTQTLGRIASLKRQKDVLEHVLHSYVNQICGLTHADPLTLQVVDAIIQKGCLFKQTASGRLLIPNWVLIFQQLYHTRLALLIGDPPAVVWVPIRAESYESAGMTMSLDSIAFMGPTLDEMIDMEFQESFLQRSPNSGHVLNEDRELIDRVMEGGSSLFMCSEMSEVEDSRRRKESSLANSSVGLEFIEVIKLRTEGELELESMVSEFCKRVDEQIAEAAKLEEGQGLASYEAKQMSDELAPMSSHLHGFSSVKGFEDSFVDDASLYAASQVQEAGHGMDSLSQLLQHCENVQKSIDRALNECF